MFQDRLWFFYALTAAVLWGLHYATAGQLSQRMPSPVISLVYIVLVALTSLLGMAFLSRPMIDIKLLLPYVTLPNLWQLLLMVFTGAVANFLAFASIADSNATKASLIEITYPLFIPIFAILLYRDNHLNVQTLIGGLIILIGINVIIK